MRKKKCESACPDCGNEDISWGLKDVSDDGQVCQDGVCNSCGCEFTEYYEYVETEWEGKMNLPTVSVLLRTAWKKAANHEKLSLEETCALRRAVEVFDRTGESLQKFFDESEE